MKYTPLEYSHYISNKFGNKDNREKLTFCLQKLIEMVKRETLGKGADSNDTKLEIKVIQQFLAKTTTESINNVINSNLDDYSKVERIISICRFFNNETFSINIIPGNLFTLFWTFCEREECGIKFSDDYQTFYVV